MSSEKSFTTTLIWILPASVALAVGIVGIYLILHSRSQPETASEELPMIQHQEPEKQAADQRLDTSNREVLAETTSEKLPALQHQEPEKQTAAEQPDTSSREGIVEDLPERPPTPEQKRAAEELAKEWIEALNNGDIETIVRMVHVPFYLDGKTLRSRDDIRNEYQKYFSSKSWLHTQVQGATATMVIELIAGVDDPLKEMVLNYYGLNSERIHGGEKIYERLKNMWLGAAVGVLRLAEYDLVVVVIAKAEGHGSELIGIFIRKISNELKIAGME